MNPIITRSAKAFPASPSARTRPRRWLSRAIATSVALLVMVGLTLASSVQVSIHGNTVTYSAQFLPPNIPVTVEIRNDTTGSATPQGPFDTGEAGSLPSSTGTTGDGIAPGTTVTVTIRDAAGNIVGQNSATKPQQENRLLGTLIRIFRWITS